MGNRGLLGLDGRARDGARRLSIGPIGPLQRLVRVAAGVLVLVPDLLVAGVCTAVVAGSFLVESRMSASPVEREIAN